MENFDLKTTPTETLVGELQSRFQASLLVVQKKAEKSGDSDETELSFSGGRNTALGLARRAEAFLTNGIRYAKTEPFPQ